MKLSKSKNVFYYRNSDNKLSEYQLLTQINPAFINKKIKMCEFQIESMYHMSASTTTCDEIMGVVSVSYPIEKLVIKIIETKARLQNYKNRSISNMVLLKTVLNHYTEKEQKQVVKYMRSNGQYKPSTSLNAYRLICIKQVLNNVQNVKNKEIQQLKTVRLHE